MLLGMFDAFLLHGSVREERGDGIVVAIVIKFTTFLWFWLFRDTAAIVKVLHLIVGLLIMISETPQFPQRGLASMRLSFQSRATLAPFHNFRFLFKVFRRPFVM